MEEAGGAESAENLALIGFMGSGKSAVGRLLAGILNMEFVDLDEVIAAQAGMSITEVFDSEGEGGFRERESAALCTELQSGGKVVSCGGGVVLAEGNVRLLRDRCRVFLLSISEAKAIERLSAHDGRPLLRGGDVTERVEELMAERRRTYLEAAHEIIDAEDASLQELAEEIAERWSKSRSGRPEGNTPSS